MIAAEQLHYFEDKARKNGFKTIAGVDEAGRGPLAGPVVAAACILPENFVLEGVDDSKKLTPLERYELYERILIENIDFGIGIVDAIRIDQINILQATFEAMLIAISHLKSKPDHILVDGNLLPKTTISAQAIIDGDALCQSIAMASIIAKVTRDNIMIAFHQKYPDYGFDTHKGYATEKHFTALAKHGPSPIHRRSFAPCA